jgi:hypothetical protein
MRPTLRYFSDFPFTTASPLFWLLTFLLLIPQVKSVDGRTLKSGVTLIGGYSSFIYEHGRVPPPVARANFEVVNSSSKTLPLKILQVDLIAGGVISKIEKFTASICSEQGDGRTACVDVDPEQGAAIKSNTRSTMTINFPSSHLAIHSRKNQAIRVQGEVEGHTLSAETTIRIKRYEPWRPRLTTHSTRARIALLSSARLGFIDVECAPG